MIQTFSFSRNVNQKVFQVASRLLHRVIVGLLRNLEFCEHFKHIDKTWENLLTSYRNSPYLTLDRNFLAEPMSNTYINDQEKIKQIEDQP